MSIKALWQILSIFLAMLLMMIFPIMNSFEKQDNLVRIAMLDELDFFVSKVKSSGYISKNDYELFSESLSNLGYPFEIKISHYKKIYVPVYEDPKDFSTFNGDVKVTEELFSNSDILDTIYPKNNDKSSKYFMNKGDYILVKVKSKCKSKYQKLRESLLNTDEKTTFYSRLGGIIQNEYK